MNTMPGYEFLTNFEDEYVNVYHNVAKAFDLNYAITIHAHYMRGEKLKGYKGFYVKSGTGSLSIFWQAVYREVEKMERRNNRYATVASGINK
jgi:hypothetical protein